MTLLSGVDFISEEGSKHLTSLSESIVNIYQERLALKQIYHFC